VTKEYQGGPAAIRNIRCRRMADYFATAICVYNIKDLLDSIITIEKHGYVIS
jgi:hypothetical protein